MTARSLLSKKQRNESDHFNCRLIVPHLRLAALTSELTSPAFQMRRPRANGFSAGQVWVVTVLFVLSSPNQLE